MKKEMLGQLGQSACLSFRKDGFYQVGDEVLEILRFKMMAEAAAVAKCSEVATEPSVGNKSTRAQSRGRERASAKKDHMKVHSAMAAEKVRVSCLPRSSFN